MRADPADLSWKGAFPRLGDFLELHPHASAHQPALRLAVSAAIPSIVLSSLGQLDLLPVALMTSVAAVYGRRATARHQLAMQAEMAALQIVVVVLGACAASATLPNLTIILLTALTAGVGTVIADRRGWSPPGAIFPTFGFAVLACSPPADDGVGIVAAVAAASGALTLTITAVWSLRSLVVGASPTAAMPRVAMHITWTHAGVCLIGGAAAGIIAVAVGLSHPYWAVVSAIVPVFGTSTHTQLVRAGHRFLGTLLGVGSSAVIFLFPFTPSTLLVLLLMLMLMVGTELFVARNYAIALFFVTPMTIGFSVLGGDNAIAGLLAARVIETILGVGIAVILVLSTHLVRHPRHDDAGSLA